jgi:hypothetical protein
VEPQIDPYLSRVDDVIHRGRALRVALADHPSSRASADVRIWQRDCEETITQLSGGSKAHWLSRAYSDALLVRAADGEALPHVDLAVIVDRILAVLDRARRAMASAERAPEADRPAGAGDRSTDVFAPHRFDFVHDPDLRPVLEETYGESRRALDERRFEDALMASCGILEAIVTDALVRRDPGRKNEIVSWPFEARLAAAHEGRLIRNGYARLPAVARTYREESDAIVLEGDARTTAQVLRIVMRDLDPGR